MKKYIFILFVILSSTNASAGVWTGDAVVSYVRTYDGASYSIGLSGIACQNSKDYFYVHDRTNNDSFFTIALSSLMSGKKVKISYTLDPNGTHCFVDGIQIAG